MKFRTAVSALALLTLTAAPSLAGETYVIDPGHSSVAFAVKHMVITNVRGAFQEFAGSIVYDAENIENSSVEVSIKTASIFTNNDKRDDHLRTSDFLDAETHPMITFKSTSVTKTDGGLVATGDLTIRGVTKSVELPFVVNGPIQNPWGQTVIGIETEPIKINREAFGVSWNKTMDNGGFVVGDEVTVSIEAEAKLSS